MKRLGVPVGGKVLHPYPRAGPAAVRLHHVPGLRDRWRGRGDDEDADRQHDPARPVATVQRRDGAHPRLALGRAGRAVADVLRAPPEASGAGLRAGDPAAPNNSAALDVYVWLCYRLHVLQEPTPINWPRLKEQFGQQYATSYQFRHKFKDTLALALAVYPGAQIRETKMA